MNFNDYSNFLNPHHPANSNRVQAIFLVPVVTCILFYGPSPGLSKPCLHFEVCSIMGFERSLTHMHAIGTRLDSGNLNDWETRRRSKNVELQYRWIQGKENEKVREMRAIFEVEASHEVIIDHLREGDKVILWLAGVKTYRIYPQTDKSWIVYNLYDIPRPLKQQDLVTLCWLKKERHATVLHITAMPDLIRFKPNVRRLENYTGKWILHPCINGKTKVEFYNISYTKPIVPRFIQDPIIQRILLNSFEKLKSLSENESAEKNISKNQTGSYH